VKSKGDAEHTLDQLKARLCINDRTLKLIPLFVQDVIIYQYRVKGLNAEFVFNAKILGVYKLYLKPIGACGGGVG
jgi:hypothetical protein